MTIKTTVDKETGEVTLDPSREIKAKPNRETKSVVPTTLSTDLTLSGSVSVMSPRTAKKAIKYLQQIKKSILKVKVDYGVIPNTGDKPTLFKPGAQKLAFFFNLTAHYSLSDVQEDFLHEWSYSYYDRAAREKKDKEVVGLFAYRIRCELIHRLTNVIWGTGFGHCVNTEKGRQSNTANTVLKMAQKRAMVQAVLDATFSSELFSQDNEDVPPPHRDTPPATVKKKKDAPPPKMCDQKQLEEVIEHMRLKDMPKPISISVSNFMGNKALQTHDNAEALVKVLRRCKDKSGAPAKVDLPAETKERNDLMNMDKDGIIDQVGFLIGQMFGTVAEEQEFLSKLVVKGQLTTVDLIDNNKGQLCNMVLKLRELAARKDN